ncbi:DUF4905 domain-containing protein [Marinigracilibium pacificum]|uniref:DUF4905 domain-containing protein n=1 Tax=Marinigracilibium pacificum TaxID=2729599 RepID=A0A848J171_9BACT|nr:DUF4905 domain-containing protein [Marinigracilibium pacificum]
MKEVLNSTFSYTFKYPVWQTVIGFPTNILGIEVRGEGFDEVSYYLFDTDLNELSPLTLNLDDPWWSRLAAISNGNIVLQEYSGEGNPEVKRVEIFNSGKKVAENNEVQFDYIDLTNGSLVFNSRNDDKNQFIFDHHENKFIPGDDDYNQKQAEGLIFPVQYPEGTEYFNDINEFLSLKSIKPCVGAVEYLETERFILISGYERIDKFFKHKLYIFDEEGSLLKEILLEKAGKGLSKDPYFIFNGKLFVIEDKNTISIYAV